MVETQIIVIHTALLGSYIIVENLRKWKQSSLFFFFFGQKLKETNREKALQRIIGNSSDLPIL